MEAHAFGLYYTNVRPRVWKKPTSRGWNVAEFDAFHIVREIPYSSVTRYIVAYGELEGKAGDEHHYRQHLPGVQRDGSRGGLQ